MNSIYRSAVNRGVKAAQPGEFAPVKIGHMSVWPPVVLAPMAGVTNYPFRSVCQQFGAGLYVSEMINARPLVDGRELRVPRGRERPADQHRRGSADAELDPRQLDHEVSTAEQRCFSFGRQTHLAAVRFDNSLRER